MIKQFIDQILQFVQILSGATECRQAGRGTGIAFQRKNVFLPFCFCLVGIFISSP